MRGWRVMSAVAAVVIGSSSVRSEMQADGLKVETNVIAHGASPVAFSATVRDLDNGSSERQLLAGGQVVGGALLDPIVPIENTRFNSPEAVADEILGIHARTGLRRYFLTGPGFNDAMFHPVPADLYARMGRSFATVKARVAAAGIEIGWWCSPSIRYRCDFPSVEDAQGHCSADNKRCPLDPGFQADFAGKVKDVVAALRPQLINIEDDYTLSWGRGLSGGACFCRRHLDAFAKRFGKCLSAAEIDAAFRERTPANLPIRRAFAETVRDSLCELAGRVRAAVDEVDPDIRICVCECGTGGDKDGDALEAIARAFAGPRTRPAIRPWGSIYGAQTTPADIPPAVSHTLYTLERTPRDIETFYEADPYPHNRFFSSASQMGSLMAGAIFMGAQNIQLYCLQYLDDPLEDSGYVDRYRALKPRLEAVRRFIEGRHARLCGIRSVWQSEDLALTRGIGQGHGGAILADEAFMFSKFGLPYTTRRDSKGPAVLAGGIVETLPDAELARLLSGALLLDAPAAAEIARRGFGADLGCEVKIVEGRLPVVREEILPAAGLTRRGRDVNAFYVYPAGTEGSVHTFAILKPHVGTETWSRFFNVDKQVLTPSMTVARNSRGGQIAVLATSLVGNRASGLFNLRKQELFQNLFRRMDAESVPLTPIGVPGIWTLANVAADGNEMMVMLNNLSGDEREEIAFAVGAAWVGAQVSYLAENGEEKPLGAAAARWTPPHAFAQMAPEFFVFRRAKAGSVR